MEACVHKRRTALIMAVGALCAGLAAGNALGASLAVARPSQGEDGTLAIPVVLTADGTEQVAALQFNVEFDPKQFALAGESAVSPGTAAHAAGKSVYAASTKPGTLQVIIAGLNQNVIRSGEVSVLHFKPHGALDQAAGEVLLTNTVMSDPVGQAVRVREATHGQPDFQSQPEDPASTTPVTADATRSKVIPVAVVLLILVAGWYLLMWRKGGSRRRSHS